MLQTGLACQFMPGICIDGRGVDTIESILIRDRGPAEGLRNVACRPVMQGCRYRAKIARGVPYRQWVTPGLSRTR